MRAEDGLALSSRNGYLSAAERAEAPRLYRCLQERAALLAGENDFTRLERNAIDELGEGTAGKATTSPSASRPIWPRLAA